MKTVLMEVYKLLQEIGAVLRISEFPDSDFANSRTAVSVIPGQFGPG